ncbi:MAG: exodeoxyribonuclease V subunit gamma [Marinobacterium sp.]|nr:exodeoxyribonuclease V subunit gamma [Marinobacterium sp.]
MLHVYHSNALDLLKELLVQHIQRQPLNDPFAAETILVQSPGMAQWLKLELADALGIAASLEFPLPASFLWKTFTQVLDGVPERSAFNKEAMGWKLMTLLPPLLAQEAFAPLQSYLADDPQGVKRYQLCAKIADVFDGYLMYRPQWVEDWEQGGAMGAESQPWQPILWRALYQRTAELGQPHWHRANMLQAFIDALRSPASAAHGAAALPERLFIFGISALPEKTLEALEMLAQRCEIHLLVGNPCQHYWGDILDQKQQARLRRWLNKPGVELDSYFDHGNPLLASMGKLGRDYIYLLQDKCPHEITAFVEPEGDHLLAAIQSDILNLHDRSQQSAPTLWQPDDSSLRLHSCHSPLREMEVLQDQLLAMFEADSTLSPREIIVMMPDVAAYAPYIEAVFGNAEPGRRIPYSISDRSLSQESPLLQCLIRLLNLADSRLPVSEVLELLEVPAVLRRFNLSQSDFDQLRHWISQVQIRWGLDSESRSALELPAFSQNSWQFGLDRMLAGFALGDQLAPWQSIAPYGDVEGLDAALLGQLADFIDLLRECRAWFQGEASLSQWQQRINSLLERTFSADEEDELALDQVRTVLEKLAEQHKDAAFEETLDAVIIRDYMTEALSSQRSSQRFMIGAVNFCTLMPMRSIPFRVVCLVGMNDGVYPRTVAPVGFDLIATSREKQRGDRSRRDDDRYLFLEALMAAQQRLYISYIGRAISDNREKVPSVLVNELLDYCADSFVVDGCTIDGSTVKKSGEKDLRKALLTEHPLTAFSPRYFMANSPASGLFSYAAQWLPAAAARLQPQPSFISRALPEEMPEQLELDELLRFYQNPVRYFFREKLRVSFDTPDADSDDEEPFSVAGLDDYLIKQRYLQSAIACEPLEPLDELLVAEGILPLGVAGQQQLSRLRTDATDLAAKLAPWCEGEPQRLEVRLDLTLSVGKLQLSGWLDGIYGGRLVRCRPSQVQGRDRLACWLNHLVYCALYPVSPQTPTVYRGLSGAVLFQPLNALDAQRELTAVLELWLEGRRRPLAFDPASGWAWQQEDDPDTGASKARQRFEGGYRQHGVCEDPYISRVYPEFDSYQEPLALYSEQIFTPMKAHMEDQNDD